MAFDAGAAISTLGLNMSPFAQGMLQATSIAQTFPQTVTAFLANPLLGFVQLSKDAADAVGEAFHGLVDTVERVAESTRALDNQARQAGVSVEFLSGVGAAFKANGSSAEGLSDALKFLNRNMGDVAHGAGGAEELTAAFRYLGISQGFVRQHLNDTEGMLLAVADGMQRIPAAADRTRIAMALLGRSGADSINVLSKGRAGLLEYAGDMDRLGATVTHGLAQQGRAFGELKDLAEEAMDGIEYAAAKPVLAALQKQFGDAKSGIFTEADLIRSKVEEVVGDIVKYVEGHGPEIIAEIKEVAKELHDLLPTLKQVEEASKAALGVVQAATDAAGITDPNKRYGNPYGGATAAVKSLDPTQISADGKGGLDKLQAIIDGYSEAQQKLVSTMSRVTAGTLKVGTIVGDGYSQDQSQQDSVRGQGALNDQRAEITAALAQIASMREQVSHGGSIDPSAMAGLVKHIQSISGGLGDAAAIVEKWHAFTQEHELKDAPSIAATLDQFKKLMQSPAAAIQNLGRDAGFHGADGGVVAPGDSGGGSFGRAATTVGNSLITFNDRVTPINDQLAVFGDNLVKINPLLVAATAAATQPATSQAPPTAAPTAAQAGVTINGGINVPPLNVSDATSQIAGKLYPVIRQANDQVIRQLDAAAQAARTQGGL